MSNLNPEAAGLRAELPLHTLMLKEALDKATYALLQEPNSFLQYTATAQQPINQRYLSGSTLTCYSDLVTDRGYRDLDAHIKEATPDNAPYLADTALTIYPYIPRNLTVQGNILTVATPVVNYHPDDGPPLKVIRSTSYQEFNKTSYNMATGEAHIVSGELYRPETTDDVTEIRDLDLFRQPEETQIRRMATLARTIQSTTHILSHAGIKNPHHIGFNVLSD